jgi:hypothetical protein
MSRNSAQSDLDLEGVLVDEISELGSPKLFKALEWPMAQDEE